MGFICDEYQAGKLPDISIYAGDTTPWSVTLVKKNGNPYPYAALTGADAKLTFMPYSVTNGVGSNVNIMPPVLCIEGAITNDPQGTGTALFTMESSDTIDLHGKYIYQVEIKNDDDVRICQGFVTIKHNINRASEED